MRCKRPVICGSIDVEDAIEDLALGILSGSSVAFIRAIHLGKEGFEERTLGVG